MMLLIHLHHDMIEDLGFNLHNNNKNYIVSGFQLITSVILFFTSRGSLIYLVTVITEYWNLICCVIYDPI